MSYRALSPNRSRENLRSTTRRSSTPRFSTGMRHVSPPAQRNALNRPTRIAPPVPPSPSMAPAPEDTISPILDDLLSYTAALSLSPKNTTTVNEHIKYLKTTGYRCLRKFKDAPIAFWKRWNIFIAQTETYFKDQTCSHVMPLCRQQLSKFELGIKKIQSSVSPSLSPNDDVVILLKQMIEKYETLKQQLDDVMSSIDDTVIASLIRPLLKPMKQFQDSILRDYSPIFLSSHLQMNDGKNVMYDCSYCIGRVHNYLKGLKDNSPPILRYKAAIMSAEERIKEIIPSKEETLTNQIIRKSPSKPQKQAPTRAKSLATSKLSIGSNTSSNSSVGIMQYSSPDIDEEDAIKLQKERDRLQDEYNKLSKSKGDSEVHNDLLTQLNTLERDRQMYEDEMTKIMAANSVLLEKMTSNPKSEAYHENFQLRKKKRLLEKDLDQITEDIMQQRSFRSKAIRLERQLPPSRDDSSDLEEELRKAFAENEAANTKKKQLVQELYSLQEEREKALFEHYRLKALATIGEKKKTLEKFLGNEEEIMAELESLKSSSSSQAFDEDRFEQNQIEENYFLLQQEAQKNSILELQLKMENETMQLRQQANKQINEYKAQQNIIKEEYQGLQNSYNHALSTNSQKVLYNDQVLSISEAQDKIEEMQNAYGELMDSIQETAGEEAKLEVDVATKELKQLDQKKQELIDWIIEIREKTLKSKAKRDALQTQLDILNEKIKNPALNVEMKMNQAIERSEEEARKLGNIINENAKRLKDIDVMLGNSANDKISIEDRLDSIQDRVAVLIRESDLTNEELDEREQSLKKELSSLTQSSEVDSN